ncbi:MAG: hypothetical protein QQN63_03095 [Nitrosopumilus sp.]
MTKRTDIHAPSFIDPSQYVYIAPVYWGGDEAMQDYVSSEWGHYMNEEQESHRDAAENALFGDNQGLDPIHKRGTTQCAHCGAHFLWGAIYYSVATQTYIVVGWICDNNTMKADSRKALEMKRLRGKVEAYKARLKSTAKALEWLADNADLIPTFSPDSEPTNTVHQSMKQSLYKYGSLTPGQAKYAPAIIEQVAKRAEAKANEPKAEPVPKAEGRMVMTGTILGFKVVDGYGYGESVIKMIVRDDRNFKVYGTLPSSIYDAEKGQRVTFTAAVEVSNDDNTFGFFKRPTKATILEGVAS